MEKTSESKTILLTGANGFVGRHVAAWLKKRHTVIEWFGRNDVDLTNYDAVRDQYTGIQVAVDQVDWIIHTAGRVRGISGNCKDNWEQLIQNRAMGENVVRLAHENAIPQGIFLGSSCQYPANAPMPFKTESLGSGHFEPTNWGYAAAKEHLRRLAVQHRYHFLIPPNLYGPGDHYGPDGHVFAAMIKKAVEVAKDGCVEHWGRPETEREFLYAPKLAQIIGDLVENTDPIPDGLVMNAGFGVSHTISLGELWKRITVAINKNPYTRWSGQMVGMDKKVMFPSSFVGRENPYWDTRIAATIDDYRQQLVDAA